MKIELDSDKLEQNPSIIKFLAGPAIIPAKFVLKNLINEIFNNPPVSLNRSYVPFKNQIYQMAFRVFSLLEDSSISIVAKPFFYGEFVQNYLLDHKLTILLNRVAPNYAHLPKTTLGKILRVVTTSLLDASFIYWIQKIRQDSFTDYVILFPTDSRLTLAVDAFAGSCITGAARELTNSNLTGIGMYLCLSLF